MPIAADVDLGEGIVIFHRDLVNLYGCSIGASTKIGAFVEIQKGAVVGQRSRFLRTRSCARGSRSTMVFSPGTASSSINRSAPACHDRRPTADRGRLHRRARAASAVGANTAGNPPGVGANPGEYARRGSDNGRSLTIKPVYPDYRLRPSRRTTWWRR